MMKKKTKRKLLFLIIIIIIVVAVLFLYPKKQDTNNKLLGIWTTDGVTKYKFNDDYTGELILPINKYKFTYELEDDKLSIDFENEKSEDSKYTYYFETDKLVLEGDNGKFIFKKNKS